MAKYEPHQSEPLVDLLWEAGEPDGREYVHRLVTDAISRENSGDLGLALVAAFKLGLNAHLNVQLKRIAFLEWHRSHESILTLLEESGDDDVLDTLYEHAHWAPADLDELDARALNSKATWAVWRLGGDLERVRADAPTWEMRELADQLLNKPR